jgi:hypothetical protein
VERDTSRDQSGDQAAWRDLVARLELPSAIDPADAPWPDRENLRPAHAAPDDAIGPGSPAGSEGQAGSAGLTGNEGQAGSAGLTGSAGPADSTGPDGSGKPAEPGADGSSANRGRVIRPASFMSFTEPAEGQPSAGARHAGQAGQARQVPPGWDKDPIRGSARGRHAGDDTLGETTHPDLGFAHLADLDSAADERYIPPQVPPLPKLDPVARGAWAALFGGPGYLFLATTLGWQVPGWAELAAIVAFVAGFVILISRLGDGPSRRDGPDHGAVV